MFNGEAQEDVTRILQSLNPGSGASQELLPLVYDELRRLAAANMARQSAGQTLQATALVHEAWLRLFDGNARVWQNRAHPFPELARQIQERLNLYREIRPYRETPFQNNPFREDTHKNQGRASARPWLISNLI
jgi:hypothetical protein